MKSFFSNTIVSVLSGIVVGVIGSYLIIDWQEENLVYVLSDPVQLGEVSYQSLTIRNAGWNPATNVIISLDKDYSGKVSAYSNPEFNVKVIEKNSIGGFERIRKDEKATVGFSVNSGRLETAMISIKSDRRVANTENNKGQFDWGSAILAVFGAFLVLGAIGEKQRNDFFRYWTETRSARKTVKPIRK